MLQGRNWVDVDMFEAGNDLERCFRIMNQQWVDDTLNYRTFMQNIYFVYGNTVEELTACILESDIRRLTAFATYFVKKELNTVRDLEVGRQFEDFVYFANVGLIDA